MAFVLSFVPHKSTKTPQNKRFIDFPSFFTGQNSTFAAAKQCSAKDLIGSKVFLDIIFSGFVPFLSRLRNIGERQKLEVIENKRVTIDKIGRNAVTTRMSCCSAASKTIKIYTFVIAHHFEKTSN